MAERRADGLRDADDLEGPPSIKSSWPMGSTPGKSWLARSFPIMVTSARL